MARPTRGIAVGFVTAASVLFFVRWGIAHWWAVAYSGMGAALMMGMIGMVAGLWAEKFDHMAAVTTFIVMPLSMLSRTFYLVDRLPEAIPQPVAIQSVFLHHLRLSLMASSARPTARSGSAWQWW